MLYRVIGLMSGSSLDGLDIVFAEVEESRGEWNYNIIHADCVAYDDVWTKRLQQATQLSAKDYLLLHTAYGHYTGECVNNFIEQHQLHHKVQIITSHGHTVFHFPEHKMTAQLGDGAAIAAVTGINVISDLRAMDVALGGQGAPIVPMGEKLLFKDADFYLNIGGIANISFKNENSFTAFDVCPANKVLNMLAQQTGKLYDENGAMALTGNVNTQLLSQLNGLDYYAQPFPKSLDNAFGVDVVFPIIQSHNISIEDKLQTYTEHIVRQVINAIKSTAASGAEKKMLVTGGGALNSFLMERIINAAAAYDVQVIVPDEQTIQYKEALVMCLLGVLRWREENTVLSSVTGAIRDSIGGAVWIGQQA